jgi:hypothetical protein
MSNLHAILCERQDERILIPIRPNRHLRRTTCMYDAFVCLDIMRLF